MIGQARGLRSVAHGGSWAGYRAELLRFPEQRTSVAVLCNLATSNPSLLAQQVAEVVLEAEMKTATPPPAPANAPAAPPPVPTASVDAPPR